MSKFRQSRMTSSFTSNVESSKTPAHLQMRQGFLVAKGSQGLRYAFALC